MKHYETLSFSQFFSSLIWIILGAFSAAYALEVFLIPNQIIDGGLVGISILFSRVFGDHWLYPCVLVLNIPFIWVAYKHIAKSLVIQMFVSVAVFVLFGLWIGESDLPVFTPYTGDLLEIVVMGGVILGFGVGLIIRTGGCLDGTEILGIMISKKYGISVGSVIFSINILIFGIAGFVFRDWHPPIQSLITFMIVIKVMDMVIVGFNEMKSVMVFSSQHKEIAEVLMFEMKLGLTFLQGSGGYSGEERKVIYLVAERLQLALIKDLIQQIDPGALIIVSSLHEVATQDAKTVSTKST